jgi:ubiquinol-cytochrome c reductase cytochrome b subunit
MVWGVVAALGAFVQINPVWIYGPDNPAAVLPSAQPDWYLGWMEGALRLFPGIHLRLGSRLVPEIFFPSILFPALIFAFLYAYPFLERWFLSRDTEPHNVLKLPYERPFSTAFGCAAFVFLFVLFFAGSDDVIASASGNSVVAIRSTLRMLVFVAPAATAVLAYTMCLIVQRRHPKP